MNKQQRNSKYRLSLIEKATASELFFKKKLESAGVRFIFQKGFIKGNYHCIVDFYIPKPYKLCIEIDGEYHSSPDQVSRDIRKDKYLASRGFKVLRIKNCDVYSFDINKIF